MFIRRSFLQFASSSVVSNVSSHVGDRHIDFHFVLHSTRGSLFRCRPPSHLFDCFQLLISLLSSKVVSSGVMCFCYRCSHVAVFPLIAVVSLLIIFSSSLIFVFIALRHLPYLLSSLLHDSIVLIGSSVLSSLCMLKLGLLKLSLEGF